jgi:hypothetical protein
MSLASTILLCTSVLLLCPQRLFAQRDQVRLVDPLLGAVVAPRWTSRRSGYR